MILEAYTPVIPALERLRQKEEIVKRPEWAIYDDPVSKINKQKSYPSKMAEKNSNGKKKKQKMLFL